MTSVVGVIHNHTPYVLAAVLRGGMLRLNTTLPPKGAARIPITVDTGFTGGFSLPKSVLSDLHLDFLGYVSYVLADGRNALTPTFQGKVVLGSEVYTTRFIPGRSLMGVEFMEMAFSSLEISLKKGRLLLR